MNKIIITGCLLAAMLFLASCGGSKNVPVATPQPVQPQTSSLGEALELDKCQICAEEDTPNAFRAWAKFNDFDQSDAYRFAVATARANMAGDIATFASDAISRFNNRYALQSSDGQKATQAKDAANKAASGLKTAAEELIRGSRVIMSSYYRQQDGTIDAYVCIEMNYDNVMAQLKNSAAVRQLISDMQKAQIDAKAEDFEESMQETFQQLREQKAQGL